MTRRIFRSEDTRLLADRQGEQVIVLRVLAGEAYVVRFPGGEEWVVFGDELHPIENEEED